MSEASALPSTRGRKTRKRLLYSLLMFGLIWVGAKVTGRWVAMYAAQRDVEQQSLSEGAPTGLLGAKWLMSTAQVQKLLPAAVQFPPPPDFESSLKLDTVVFERNAFVDFFFENDLLLMILVSFKGDKTSELYRSTQVALEGAYGRFPDPTATKDHELASTKRFGRVVVEHLLYELMGLRLEQVLLYRAERSN